MKKKNLHYGPLENTECCISALNLSDFVSILLSVYIYQYDLCQPGSNSFIKICGLFGKWIILFFFFYFNSRW